MLPFTVAAQRLQAVPGRRCQVTQFRCSVQLPKLSASDLLNRLKAPTAYTLVETLGFGAPK
jgi:hypothetical protein